MLRQLVSARKMNDQEVEISLGLFLRTSVNTQRFMFGSVLSTPSIFLPQRGEGCLWSEAEQTGGGSRYVPRSSPLRLAALGTSPTMGEETRVRAARLNLCAVSS